MVKVFKDIVEKQGLYEIVGIIDSKALIGSEIEGIKVIGRQEDIATIQVEYDIHGGCITIGDNYSRFLVHNEIKKRASNFEWVNTIHPSCIIADNVKIGKGIIAMANCIFNPNAEIDDFTAFYTGAIIEHDCKISRFASISAGSVLGGKVFVGDYSAVTLGCTVFDRVNIAHNVVVGSGSLVTKDIPANQLWYGNPAKFIKNRELTEKFLK